jgi:hypothetical protein
MMKKEPKFYRASSKKSKWCSAGGDRCINEPYSLPFGWISYLGQSVMAKRNKTREVFFLFVSEI